MKIVILRLGVRSETFLRLFSRAPRISMYSWGMKSAVVQRTFALLRISAFLFDLI